MEQHDIAFLEEFVRDWGAWPLTLICLLPAFAFIAYVVWDDRRQARAHPHAPPGSGEHSSH